jgi:large subunit ribosomal protein L32e
MATKADVLKEFQTIKGIGKTKAEALYEAGYTTIDKLRKASTADLAKVKGMTPKTAGELHTALKAHKPKKEAEKKTQKKEEKPTEEPTGEAAEGTKIVEPGEKVYKPKIKPELSADETRGLIIRRQIKKRTPYFLRAEGFRYKKLKKNWRRPTGYTGKLRMNLGYRPSKVRVGFSSPNNVRSRHSSGFEEIPVYTPKDLDKINPKTQAGRIGGSVGTKKRLLIAKRADELKIRLLNFKR